MKRLLPILGFMLLISAVHAQSIATIELRNRPAAEVIPIVQPLLQTGESISGHGFKLFLRASAQTLAEVRDVVAALDAPLKTLQISVFQGSTRGLRELGLSGGIRIERGDASVDIGSGNDDSGGSITIGGDSGSASVGGTSTRKRLQNNPIHQIRVSEGRQAYIETGKQIPLFSGNAWIGHKGTSGGVEYQDVVTGFYVLPRIHGDSVTLEVSPFKNTANRGGGNIETQSARTTISGRIGDWLLIGGVSEQLRRSQSGIGSSVSTQSRINESIWIKADLVQ